MICYGSSEVFPHIRRLAGVTAPEVAMHAVAANIQHDPGAWARGNHL